MVTDQQAQEAARIDDFVFGGDAADIPPGTYPATLKAIGTKSSNQYGDFRTWDFALDNGSEVGGASSMNTGPKSKGGRWAMALLGRKPEKGERVNLIGRRGLIVVGLNKDDWPEVTDVLPPMATTVAQGRAESVGNGEAAANESLGAIHNRQMQEIAAQDAATVNARVAAVPIGSDPTDDDQLPF